MLTRKHIIAARKRLGETQVAFAKRFGVHQATIHDWETAGPSKRPFHQQAIERVLADLRMEPAE
jgi:DNA-binding transcriptional regulator YiaG